VSSAFARKASAVSTPPGVLSGAAKICKSIVPISNQSSSSVAVSSPVQFSVPVPISLHVFSPVPISFPDSVPLQLSDPVQDVVPVPISSPVQGIVPVQFSVPVPISLHVSSPVPISFSVHTSTSVQLSVSVPISILSESQEISAEESNSFSITSSVSQKKTTSFSSLKKLMNTVILTNTHRIRFQFRRNFINDIIIYQIKR
jgi:hypothetical protein